MQCLCLKLAALVAVALEHLNVSSKLKSESSSMNTIILPTYTSCIETNNNAADCISNNSFIENCRSNTRCREKRSERHVISSLTFEEINGFNILDDSILKLTLKTATSFCHVHGLNSGCGKTAMTGEVNPPSPNCNEPTRIVNAVAARR